MAIAGLVLAAWPAQAQPDGMALLLQNFGVKWGASVFEAEEQASIRLRRLDRPLDYGPFLAPLVLADLPILESRYFVFFQFERKSGALQQILVQRRRADGERAVYDNLTAILHERLGEPAESCHTPARASTHRLALRWSNAAQTLRLILLDYRHPGIITEGEPMTDDPTVPWYKRQALDPAALPVRVLLRLSPPDDATPGC